MGNASILLANTIGDEAFRRSNFSLWAARRGRQIEDLCDLIAEGVSIAKAASLVGLTYSQALHSWHAVKMRVGPQAR